MRMSFWRWSALALLSTCFTLAGLLVLGVDFEKIKWWHGLIGMFLLFGGADMWPSVTTWLPKSWLPKQQ